MEHPSHIDDLMRQRLRQTEVPPPAFVWPNVERALRRRKRRFFFWFLTGSLTAGMLAVGLWALWNQAEKPATTRPVAHAEPAVPASDARPGTATAPAHPVKSDMKSARSTSEPATTTPEKYATTAAPAKPAASAHRGYTLPAGKLVSAAKDAGKQSNPDANQPRAQDRLAEAETDATSLAPTVDEGQGIAQLSKSEPSATPLPIPLGLLNLPARETTLAAVKAPPTKTKRVPKKCYDFHAHPSAWLVDAYAGPSWAGKSLQTADSELQDYLLNRERTEIRTWGYNAGVRASYLFAGNFLLRTGLHLDHFEEQFEYIDPNFIQYNITITQKYVNGQWVSVTDTIGILYGTNYLKSYNRFAMLDIPLQAALELRSGATGVSLNLGGSVNLLFEKRGSMLDTTGKPVSFTPGSGQNEVFRTSLGMSLIGSIQWFYHLNPRTRVFVEPYYRHILDPVTRPELPYEQSYGVGGVRLGLTRIFD